MAVLCLTTLQNCTIHLSKVVNHVREELITMVNLLLFQFLGLLSKLTIPNC